jgi:hypothetical protein
MESMRGNMILWFIILSSICIPFVSSSDVQKFKTSQCGQLRSSTECVKLVCKKNLATRSSFLVHKSIINAMWGVAVVETVPKQNEKRQK